MSHRFRPALVATLALSTLVCGCRTLATPTQVTLQAAEKDVLVYRVEVAEPVSPAEYLRWSEEQLRRIGGDPHNPFYPSVPVYDLYYSFHCGSHHLASVLFERQEPAADEGAHPAFRHLRTLVFSPQENLP